jgi:hypothetical protein
MQFAQAHITEVVSGSNALTLTIPQRGLDGKPVVVDGKLQRRPVTEADVDLWRSRLPAELVDAALGVRPCGAPLRQWLADRDAAEAAAVRGMVADVIAAGVSRVTTTAGTIRDALASNVALARAEATGRAMSAAGVQRWAERVQARGLTVQRPEVVAGMAATLEADAAHTLAAAATLRSL